MQVAIAMLTAAVSKGPVVGRTDTISRVLSDVNAAYTMFTMFERMALNTMDSCLRRNDDREGIQISRWHSLPRLM